MKDNKNKDGVFKDYRYYEKYRTELKSLLTRVDWEWFCTLNLEYNDLNIAESKLRKWIRGIAKTEHMRVCYSGCFVSIKHPHLHLLMAGLDKYGYTLNDKWTGRSEAAWKRLARHSAVIEYVKDEGAASYISFCNTPPDQFELVIPYNKKLLEKKRLMKQNPALSPVRSAYHPYESNNLLRFLNG